MVWWKRGEDRVLIFLKNVLLVVISRQRQQNCHLWSDFLFAFAQLLLFRCVFRASALLRITFWPTRCLRASVGRVKGFVASSILFSKSGGGRL